MSDETIRIDLIINSAESATTLKEVKQSMKDITAELEKTAVGSENYNKLSSALGKAKAEMKDFKDQISAFDPDAKFGAFAKVTSGLAGGLQAATGAMALFGVESENVQKTLLKVQAATALAQGIKSVEELGDAFAILNQIIKANPILAIASAIIALGGIIGGIIAKTVDWRSEDEKLLDQAKERLKIEQEDIKIIDGKTNQLKLQGKSEKEILQMKIKETDEAIVQAQLAVKQQQIIAKQQEETAQRNKDILSGILRFITAPITWILEAYDYITGSDYAKMFGDTVAGFFFDPEETKKKADEEIKLQQDALDALVEQRAGYQLAVNNIDKDAYAKKKEQEDKYFKELKEKYEDFQEFVVQKTTETADQEITAKTDSINELSKALDEDFKKQIEREKAIADAKKSIQQDSFSALTSLGTIFISNARKLEKFNKGLALTQILLDTAQAISALVKNSEANPANAITGGVAGIAQFASGIARILANIAKAKQLLSKAGETPSISLSGGGGGNAGSGVPLNPITSNSTLLNPDGTPVTNEKMKDIKVVVLETDITNTQNKVASIQNRATFE